MIKQKVTCLVEALLISMGKYFGEIYILLFHFKFGWLMQLGGFSMFFLNNALLFGARASVFSFDRVPAVRFGGVCVSGQDARCVFDSYAKWSPNNSGAGGIGWAALRFPWKKLKVVNTLLFLSCAGTQCYTKQCLARNQAAAIGNTSGWAHWLINWENYWRNSWVTTTSPKSLCCW